MTHADPRYGVAFINEEWDLKAYLALAAERKLSLGAWTRSLARVRSFAVAARDDPRPIAVIG